MHVLITPPIENFDLVEKNFPNVTFDKTFFSNIKFSFTNKGPKVTYDGTDCSTYDFAWIASYWGTRDLAFALQLFLDSKGVKHTNVKNAGTKVTDHMVFSINSISSPNTFFINRMKLNDEIIGDIEKVCGYPIIIKDIKGCRGNNTFLAKDRDELLIIVKSFEKNIKYMFQEFIPNDYDWGVLVANGKVEASEKSIPKEGEFRNNACNGAKEIFVDVDECPDEVKEIALKAAKALKLDWCRSDIVVNKNTGKPYLLEVNRYPGITKGTDEVKAVITHLEDILSV